MNKNFKGFKQVTSEQFGIYKEQGLLEGYLWFVRTPVLIEGEETPSTSNDIYDIYFGKKHYGHFCDGEIESLKDSIDEIRSDLGFIPGSFEFGEGVTTIKGAFETVAEMISALTGAVETLKVKDVQVDGKSVVNENGVAEIVIPEVDLTEVKDYADGIKEELKGEISKIEEDYKAADGEILDAAKEYAKQEITNLIGSEENKGIISDIVASELAAQLVPEDAQESLNTLQEIAEWIQSHPEDAAAMNERIAKLEEINHEAYIDADVKTLESAKEFATTESRKALESSKEYADNNFVSNESFTEYKTQVNEKLETVESGAQENVIENISINGIEGSIEEKIASVKVTGEDIELGADLMAENQVKYPKETKLSSVLQGIQNSITQAAAGSYLGVLSGKGIEVSDIIASQQTISVKVDKKEGNLISVSQNGIFAAMYYDGDDVDPDGEEVINYKSLIEKGGNVTLNSDYALENSIVLENTDSVVNLNGKLIQGGLFTEQNGSFVEGDTDSYVFWAKEGSNLEINGNGIIQSKPAKYSMAVWAQGGTVTINGGTYVNAGEGSDLIYASNGGKVYIYGGVFKPNKIQPGVDGTKQDYCALNIKDGDRDICEIKVYGGKFYGFNPADNKSETEHTNFVADGYKSVEIEPGVWEVVAE